MPKKKTKKNIADYLCEVLCDDCKTAFKARMLNIEMALVVNKNKQKNEPEPY